MLIIHNTIHAASLSATHACTQWQWIQRESLEWRDSVELHRIIYMYTDTCLQNGPPAKYDNVIY